MKITCSRCEFTWDYLGNNNYTRCLKCRKNITVIPKEDVKFVNCCDCGILFKKNGHSQKRCIACKKKNKNMYERRAYIKNHEHHLQRGLINSRKSAGVKEFRAEIKNCIVCGVDISNRHRCSKYCVGCSYMSQHHKYINGKWIGKRNFKRGQKAIKNAISQTLH